MKNITIQSISGHKVKVIPYGITVSEDLDYLQNLYRNPKPGLLLKCYTLDSGRVVSFHPKEYTDNLLNFCAYVEQYDNLADNQHLLKFLMNQLKSHACEVDSALYFRYPFICERYSRILNPPWFSGIAQGFILAALIKLYQITGGLQYLDMVRKTYKSFIQIRDEVGQKRPWISFVDDAQYLWFEEYPTDYDPQIRVLNGHIYAIMGLYSYYRLEPNDDTLTLMRAGMTTVQRYFNKFRRPGKVNKYCLLPNSEADYWPARSVRQQKWLFDVTNDQTFKKQYLAFQSDMP